MRIVVAGASGSVGRRLCPALRALVPFEPLDDDAAVLQALGERARAAGEAARAKAARPTAARA